MKTPGNGEVIPSESSHHSARPPEGKALCQAAMGYRCASVDGFEGAVVHRGANSLRLIGEAGTLCLRERNDVCSLQKRKPSCYVKIRMCAGGGPFCLLSISLGQHALWDTGWEWQQRCLSTCFSSLSQQRTELSRRGPRQAEGDCSPEHQELLRLAALFTHYSHMC